MRNPAQILNSLAIHSSVSEYRYERLYRLFFNEQMFFAAYQRIYAKPGNMTAGTDGRTIDQMNIRKIEALLRASEMRAINPIPQKEYTSPKRTANYDHWGFRLLRTNSFKR